MCPESINHLNLDTVHKKQGRMTLTLLETSIQLKYGPPQSFAIRISHNAEGHADEEGNNSELGYSSSCGSSNLHSALGR
jgi:hypothetical protein